jgi:hypothetical protein
MAMNAPPEGYESSASEGLRFPSRGFFSTTFGKDWQKKEKAFWEEIHSGKYEQKPVILKK